MIKFRILNYVLVLMVALCILGLLFMTFMLYALHLRSEEDPEIITLVIIGLVKVLLLTIALSFTKQATGTFLRQGYFNAQSARFLNVAGYTMAASSLVTLVANLTEIAYVDRDSLPSYSIEVIYDSTVLLVGLALLGVADIIKKGISIKHENDLTI
ncbi:DUF2975 domain-containing protein [uncultured Flavobacterium sp.]|uniref:DUF2975 domain-containing protein n=1 Tax=uncultured Flavobacterium sp. TaxID=165435 RepID=UPI0025FAEB09|nr:DUF2975 domain-containing protein [uncultured Flavobacterium sp.]